MNPLETYQKEIKSAESRLKAIDAKMEEAVARLEATTQQKKDLDDGHRNTVARYTKGKATSEEVQEAASKIGSLDGAINAMKATIAVIKAEREKAEVDLIGIEKRAAMANMEALHLEATRMIEEAEARIKEELARLFVAARAADHPSALPSNTQYRMERIINEASSMVDRGEAPTPEEIGFKLQRSIRKSPLVSLERRQEIGRRHVA